MYRYICVGKFYAVHPMAKYVEIEAQASITFLNLSIDFRSQYLNDNAKRFDNHVVVFVNGLYKTEGDSPYKYYNDTNNDCR